MVHQSETGIDRTFWFEHFNPYDRKFPDELQDAIPDLISGCPVAHTDAFGGFWVVSSYEHVSATFQDWRTFSSAKEKSVVPLRPGTPTRRPIDLDPPFHTRYRQLLNPFLTPERIARYEPGVRALVTELIDAFIDDGSCDLTGQFSMPFPGRMLYRFLFGIDDAEVAKCQGWIRKVLLDPVADDTPQVEQEWIDWMLGIIERRRLGPRQDDIIDALLHAEIEGSNPTDHEIMGTMMVLITGGFSTTAHAISNTMMRLAERPALQARLRANPHILPLAIDEFLRYDSPVAASPRLCVADTEVGGRHIRAGDRVLILTAAANRDPAEFADPEELDVDRSPNRHLAFGVGPHRCIGSNVARFNYRIAMEELLDRLGEFHLTEGDRARRDVAVAWGPAYLPLTFNRR